MGVLLDDHCLKALVMNAVCFQDTGTHVPVFFIWAEEEGKRKITNCQIPKNKPRTVTRCTRNVRGRQIPIPNVQRQWGIYKFLMETYKNA